MSYDRTKRPLRTSYAKRERDNAEIAIFAALLLVLAAAVLILFAKLALWSLAAAALMSGAALWLKKWGEDKKKYLDSHPPPKDEGRSP